MITFKDFLLLEGATGAHGEYANDVGEKTLVNRIIALLLNGQRTEENYDLVYSFIEDSKSEPFYEKYYDVFAEYAEANKNRKSGEEPKPLPLESRILLNKFKKEVGPLFRTWQASRKAK